MPNYKDKILVPVKPEQFNEAYDLGKFAKENHKGFFVLLYYLGLRCSEALAVKKEDFKIYPHTLFVTVKRLKKERKTKKKKKRIKKINPKKWIDTIELNREWKGVNDLIHIVNQTEPTERVFPYCRKTGYNIIKRCFDAYPHYLRFSVITNLLMWGWTIPEIKKQMGLSVEAINYYILEVDLKKRQNELTNIYKEG